MLRKLFATVAVLFVSVGLAFADHTQVQGLFKKFENNKVTVEFQGKTQDFKVGEKVQYGKNQVAGKDAFTKFKSGDGILILVDKEKEEVFAVGKAKK